MSIRSAFILNLVPWMLLIFGVATFFTYKTASNLMESNYQGVVRNETSYLARHWADGREFPALTRVKQVLPLESANRLPLRDVGSLKLSVTEHHLLLGLKDSVVRTHPTRRCDLIVALAPVISPANALNGVVVATYRLEPLTQDRRRVQMTLFLSFILVSFLLFVTSLIAARKISRPLEKLQASALAIAGGNYEQRVDLKGPQEIATLAHTLNTMSECLEESHDRRKERAIIQERLHGKQQCASDVQLTLLQMSCKRIEKWDVLPLLYPCSAPYGLKIETDQDQLRLVRAKEAGLKGMLALYLDEKGEDQPVQRYQFGEVSLLTDQATEAIFGGDEAFENICGRICHHFAQDGLAAVQQMLSQEIHKRVRGASIEQDLFLIIAKR